MVEDAHAVGMKVLGITGNAKNARRMAESGIDLLVAQGHEGGGHTGRIGTMVLVPAAIDAAHPVPVPCSPVRVPATAWRVTEF